MLTSKQKKHLKSLANTLDSIFQVGKNDLSENLIKQLDDALEARELIKIKILKNSIVKKDDAAEEIAKATNSEVVQILGSVITLYRKSKKSRIELPS
ncbi:ribosome assembly RNA-binding protein YhbY [Alkalicella caledoniensis]|uniref:Ribosome assembly RNA-binding protein YhbY n=1 Tax=Alkalicella caledoniensis TaxID=2731377 RepID=A0A7G9W4I0_ALKCA|nr:ribosome assembly RNA-binding protein YhbY [Alkalicella caledoniensis]QNO13592.1 ribosome assembly RNA-binding protein YhbY [Alkalicella caledoniensis]